MGRYTDIINKMGKRGESTNGLHDRLGIDFQKKFRMIKVSGRFTVNQLRKEAEQKGYNCSDSIILLLFNVDKAWRKNDLFVVKITSTGFAIDPYEGYASGIDKIYRKGDFEDYRKHEMISGYLFCQKKAYLCPVKSKYDPGYRPTTTERYKFIKFYYSQEMTLMRTDCNGQTFGYRVYDGVNADNIREYIDKSGYLIREIRQELAGRLKEYKAQKAKKAYLAQDYTAKVAALADLIRAKQNLLADEFAKAATAADIDKIRDKMGWNGLYRAMMAYERMVEQTAEKAFSSIESFESAYNGIMKQLATI